MENVPASSRLPKIGIWGHYGGANQGDELVVTTLIANIRDRLPNAEIIGFSMNPADTRQRHGIVAFPLRESARGGQPEKPWCPADAHAKKIIIESAGNPSRIRAFLKRSSLLVSLVKGIRKKCRTLAAICREIASIADSYRDLRGTDALIVAGSGPLIDNWGGVWAQPYAFYKWSILARLCGTRFICLSAGAGPIDRWLSRVLLRRGVRKTDYRSYRDPSSAKLIASLGVKGEHPVFPDMAFGLDVAPYARTWSPPASVQSRTIIGLGVMAWLDPRFMPQSDPRRYGTYIRKMAEFAAWLLKNDYAIVAVYSDIRFDPQAFADVRALLSREHNLHDDALVIDQPIDGLTSLISRYSACDFVIGTRYHGIILPWLLNKPVLGIAYNVKAVDLMESMGQSAYCVDFDRFEVADLIERFRSLEANRDSICHELKERVAENRERLAEQYDCVLNPFAVARNSGAFAKVGQPALISVQNDGSRYRQGSIG